MQFKMYYKYHYIQQIHNTASVGRTQQIYNDYKEGTHLRDF